MEHTYQNNRTASIFNVPSLFRLVCKRWFELFLLGILLHVVLNKNISIELNLHAAGTGPLVAQAFTENGVAAPVAYEDREENSSRNTSQLKGAGKKHYAANIPNLTFVLSPSYARRKNIAPEVVAEKMETCQKYIRQYAGAALAEGEKYGIPASITLAQGLLESNAGDSRLSLESNNHFGIKCRTKCRGCTCRNYRDDDVYDMFRVFESPWNSFRAHSELLTGKRYQHLLKLDRTDYQGWAKGLKKAGYATDKRYAEKLIRIIETFELDRFDD